jgi:hypothetical protein
MLPGPTFSCLRGLSLPQRLVNWGPDEDGINGVTYGPYPESIWKSNSKYLEHTLYDDFETTHPCPACCSALNWEPDEEGINGMVITKTLPSEAAKVLDKGVRKMTPRIMTWYQYGEAALHYMQQVKGGDCVGGGGGGFTQMKPRIMTWCQHGEAPLHYMQQVRGSGVC